jgi:mannose-1-phosphate guanylyltransferase
MIICILAGGEGSRLWPLSTSTKPKQILSLTGKNTLIQNTYDLMKKITNDIFIVSESSHYKEILKQVKSFDKTRMIVEPCRRGTTNCTLLAISFIKKYYNQKKNDEKILFIHADHIFSNLEKFIETIKVCCTKQSGDIIVIGGKKPTYPGTKYGYVETKKIKSDFYKVIKFHEKPTLEIAKKL